MSGIFKKATNHIRLLRSEPNFSYLFKYYPFGDVYTKFRSAKNSVLKPPYKVIFPEPLILKEPEINREILNLNLVSYWNRFPVIPEVCLYELENATLFPFHGTILDSNGFAIVESHKTIDDLNNRSILGKKILKTNSVLYSNKVCSTIFTSMGSGYGHFLIDHLPRLYALQFYEGEITLLLPENLMPVLKQLIEWIKPDNCKIEYISENIGFQCGKVILTPFTTIGGFGYQRKEITEFLKKGIHKNIGNYEGKNKIGIYITRRKAPYYNISNEEELIFELSKRGIMAVDLEDLNINEQIKLFQKANLICGSQSSGFANLIFAENAKVVQFLWKRKNNPSIGLYDYGISLSYGHDYLPYVQFHDKTQREQINIDILNFIKQIDKINL